MKIEESIFVLSILGIGGIIFLGEFSGENFSGEVLEIESFSWGIVLNISGMEEEIVVFSDELIELSVGDEVFFNGRREYYQGKDQIIAEKMWKF